MIEGFRWEVRRGASVGRLGQEGAHSPRAGRVGPLPSLPLKLPSNTRTRGLAASLPFFSSAFVGRLLPAQRRGCAPSDGLALPHPLPSRLPPPEPDCAVRSLRSSVACYRRSVGGVRHLKRPALPRHHVRYLKRPARVLPDRLPPPEPDLPRPSLHRTGPHSAIMRCLS